MVRYTAGAKGITVTRWEAGRPAKISREKMVNPNPEATSRSTPASVESVAKSRPVGGGSGRDEPGGWSLPGLWREKGIGVERLHPYRGLLGQGMVSGDHHHVFVPPQRGGGPGGAVVADIKGAVYLLPLQAGEQFIVPVPLHQLDGGAGKLGVKLLQQRGQPGGSDAGQSADAQRVLCWAAATGSLFSLASISP